MGRDLGKQTAPGFAVPDASVTVAQAGAVRPAAAAATLRPNGAETPSADESGPVPPQAGQAVQAVQAVQVASVANMEAPDSENRPGSAHRPQSKTPMLEVEVSYERGPAPHHMPARSVLEIWTQNSVYMLDSRMRCLEVCSPSTGETIPDHPFVQTRMVGGQWQSDEGVELSYPLPRPGSCAVFEGQRGNKRRFSRTSAVERVVLRQQVVAVTASGDIPSWAELVED